MRDYLACLGSLRAFGCCCCEKSRGSSRDLSMQYTKLVGSRRKMVGREVVDLSVSGIEGRTARGSGRNDEAIIINISVCDIVIIVDLLMRNDFTNLSIDCLDHRGKKREWLTGLNAPDVWEMSNRILVNRIAMDIALLFHWNEWVREHLGNLIQSEKNSGRFCIGSWLAASSSNEIAILIINPNGMIVFVLIRQRGKVMNDIINLACRF